MVNFWQLRIDISLLTHKWSALYPSEVISLAMIIWKTPGKGYEMKKILNKFLYK